MIRRIVVGLLLLLISLPAGASVTYVSATCGTTSTTFNGTESASGFGDVMQASITSNNGNGYNVGTQAGSPAQGSFSYTFNFGQFPPNTSTYPGSFTCTVQWFAVQSGVKNAIGPAFTVQWNGSAFQLVAPVVTFTVSPNTGTAPLAVTVNYTGTTADTWSWAFGDGGTGTGSSSSHTYNSPGTFSITCTASNQGGPSGTGSNSVTVSSPTANQPPNPGGNANITVTVKHAGATQSGYSVSITGGSTTRTGTTNSSGVFSAANVPGDVSYTIQAWGTSNTTPPIADSGSKYEFVAAGTNAAVSFDFQANGTDTGGDTNEANRGLESGISDIMNKVSSAVTGAVNAVTTAVQALVGQFQTMLQTLLTSLFVPQQSSLNNLQSQWTTLWDWGPITFLTECKAAFDGAGSGGGMPTFTIPGVGSMPIGEYADAMGWSTIRMIESGALWCGFIWYLIRKFTPEEKL